LPRTWRRTVAHVEGSSLVFGIRARDILADETGAQRLRKNCAAAAARSAVRRGERLNRCVPSLASDHHHVDGGRFATCSMTRPGRSNSALTRIAGTLQTQGGRGAVEEEVLAQLRAYGFLHRLWC
jgi:hypothetical protein